MGLRGLGLGGLRSLVDGCRAGTVRWARSGFTGEFEGFIRVSGLGFRVSGLFLAIFGLGLVPI